MSSVVGVDLGYQNSVIAAAGRGGVDVILNGNSNRLNPSMVGFDESRKMGELATSGASSNYKYTVTAMKRLIGLAFDDPVATREMQRLPLQFCRVPHADGVDSIGVQTSKDPDANDSATTVVPMEAVAGMMVRHMGTIVAQKIAQETNTSVEANMPQDWVLTIPSYYTDAQRRALLAGCAMVGLTGVQRLLHETTATALAYGIFKDLKKEFQADQPTHVLFLDMGASAYTVSLVAFEPGKLIVKSTTGDANLGGRDFDWMIVTWMANKFAEKFGAKLSGNPLDRPKTVLKLLAAAEKAKKTLSPQGVKEARINLEMLMDDLDFSITLTAAEYEQMCEPLLARLEAPIVQALAEGKLTAADLHSVEIVGGSTRIGCVKRALTGFLTNSGAGAAATELLSTTLNADEAVARGAALQSAILSPRFKVLPYDIHEFQAWPIQLRWDEDANDEAQGMEVDATTGAQPTNAVVMFDRGLSFPIVRRVTLKRNQGTFAVQAEYNEKALEYGLPASGNAIATFSVQAPISEEAKKIRVNVKQDIHGIIQLSSAQMVEEIADEEEPESSDAAPLKDGEEAAAPENKKKKVKKTNLVFTTTRPLDWTEAEIQKAYQAELAMALKDKLVQETSDKRNELESYIYDMRDKIGSESALGSFGTDAEKAAFITQNEAMENWLYEDGFDASKETYATKLKELQKLGSPMERRQAEQEGRPAAVSTLQQSLEKYQNWVNQEATDEAYAHITDDERQRVQSKCDEISAWMYDMLDQQGALPNHQDAVLTVFDLQAKNKDLIDTCGPVLRKPKPAAPKKEPEPAAQPEGEAKTADEVPPPEPMEGVEESEAKPAETMETD
jgi:heat shock protein 4